MYNRKEIIIKSKELRRNLTPEEAVLWTQLKSHKLNNSKWRKQHPIGSYILDFYCPKCRLCIELDGKEHYTMQGDTYDYDRTVFLNSYGIRVLRFENKDVWDNIEGVLNVIREEITACGTPSEVSR